MEEPVTVQCPYCGESFVTFVDISAGNQNYIEDCQVCCKPITMGIVIDSHDGSVYAATDRSN